MTRSPGLMRLFVKTYVVFSLYRASRCQTAADISNETREVLDEHYRDQLELFTALAGHLLELRGGGSTKLAPIIRDIDTFDAQRRTCAAEHLRVLLAAHQTVLTEINALISARSSLSATGSAEMVDRIALTNELQRRIVAGQLTASGQLVDLESTTFCPSHRRLTARALTRRSAKPGTSDPRPGEASRPS